MSEIKKILEGLTRKVARESKGLISWSKIESIINQKVGMCETDINNLIESKLKSLRSQNMELANTLMVVHGENEKLKKELAGEQKEANSWRRLASNEAYKRRHPKSR